MRRLKKIPSPELPALLNPGQIEEDGENIEKLDIRADPLSRQALAILEDEGHTESLIVEVMAVSESAVFPEFLAMVRRENDQGIIEDVQVF
jgi:hypothetical protein